MIFGAMVELLERIDDSADTLMLYVDPVISPLIVALVVFPTLMVDIVCSPCCW